MHFYPKKRVLCVKVEHGRNIKPGVEPLWMLNVCDICNYLKLTIIHA